MYCSEQRKALRAKRLAAGKCPECGRPQDNETKRCSVCRNKNVEWLRKRNTTDKQRKLAADYTRERRRNNIQVRLSNNLRSRLWHALKERIKQGSAVSDLGCTVDELKTHMENQFQEGMSWDNYGNCNTCWSIDHIIPISSVDLTNREQFLQVNHYTNLQPLWHLDNITKGNR